MAQWDRVSAANDLMIFERAQGEANVATLIERKTRYTVLLRNNGRKSRPLMNRLIHEMSPLPAEARRSITFDRGLEFVAWRDLESGRGTRAWFCGPPGAVAKGLGREHEQATTPVPATGYRCVAADTSFDEDGSLSRASAADAGSRRCGFW